MNSSQLSIYIITTNQLDLDSALSAKNPSVSIFFTSKDWHTTHKNFKLNRSQPDNLVYSMINVSTVLVNHQVFPHGATAHAKAVSA